MGSSLDTTFVRHSLRGVWFPTGAWRVIIASIIYNWLTVFEGDMARGSEEKQTGKKLSFQESTKCDALSDV